MYALLTALFAIQVAAVPDISDNLAANQDGKIHQLDVSGYSIGSYIRVEFRNLNSNLMSTIGIEANTEQQTAVNSIKLQDFYGEDPIPLGHYDIDALWEARDTQYVNVRKRVGENTLYLTVFRFDPSYRAAPINYEITLSQNAGPLCAPCANLETYNLDCRCLNCRDGKTGRICSRYIYEVNKNVSTTIQPLRHYYFALPEAESIVIEMSVKGGVAEGYVQFEDFKGEVASFYNVAQGTSDGRYLLANNGIRITASPMKKRTLVTVICFTNSFAEFNLTYYTSGGVSVLIIVMAVLGGLILVGLIIAALCIIKRNRSHVARVRSEMELPSNNNKLSTNEIQRFFPCVVLRDVLSGQKEDASNAEISLNQMNKEGGSGDQDCVICLETIQPEEEIRMGYCKHMFHSNCLVSWFNKQRNCPYCRKEYNREETEKGFQALVEKNENRNLQGLGLVKAIYNSKPVSTAVIENIE